MMLNIQNESNWKVYIILCSDDSLYTGITTDMERRLCQHAEGSGAKYFRGRQPRQLVYLENGHSRSSAGTREARIKSMKHADKLALVTAAGNELADSEVSNINWQLYKGTNI